MTTTTQWAAWLRESADQADDLTEGQRDGFRIAAEHLEDPRIQAHAARIDDDTTCTCPCRGECQT